MPKKPKTKLKVVKSEAHEGPPSDHNLSSDQQAALFHNHVRKYAEGYRLAERAKADFRNICKMIKAEGTPIADVKTAIRLSGEDGEEAVRAEIEAMIRIARWMGASVGHQIEMFDDRRSPQEHAYDAGKVAGLAGQVRKAPDGLLEERWMEGWNDGQAALTMKLKAPKPPKQKVTPPEPDAAAE
jgi:hypothetical protein